MNAETSPSQSSACSPTSASSPRLLVLEVLPTPTSKVLRTLDTIRNTQLSISLQDEWVNTKVLPSDIVRVILTHPDNGAYLPWSRRPHSHPLFITHQTNLLIHHPDTLVSGTAIADSFLCLRKSVLNSRVPPRNILHSAGAEAALFGSIIHDLIQRLLSSVFPLPPDQSHSPDLDIMHVFEAVEDLIHNHLEDLYAANISDKHARLVLHHLIPSITEWFNAFIPALQSEPTDPSMGVDVPAGKTIHKMAINDVYDIEELVWSPIFGLKGKIDASILLRTDNSPPAIGALELKTGSSVGFAAVSHAAQVNLYNLLLSDRYGAHVTQGLVSYIRYQDALKSLKRDQSATPSQHQVPLIETRGNFTNQPNNKAVSYVRAELVGLIMQRNEFAKYSRLGGSSTDLPPLLQGREDLCAKCFANDSCMIQHMLLEKGNRETVQGGPGPDLFREKTAHLTAQHADYYEFWKQVLADEEAHAGQSQSEVWTMRGCQREALGRCISNLRLIDDSTDQEGIHNNFLLPPGQRLIATFRRHNTGPSQGPPKDTALSNGDFVLVSAESYDGQQYFPTFNWQTALTNGFVQSLSSSTVTVVVDRSLFSWARHQHVDVGKVSWRIDTNEIYASHNTAKRTLENLFCNDEATSLSRLRKLAVDGERPSFADQVTSSQSISDINDRFQLSLNDDQNRALQMALRAKDYLLILGMPGTGKTTTLAAIVLACVSQCKSVLLCAHTNSAVDNLLQRFLAVGFKDFVRLGRNLRVINKAIHPHHISALTDRLTNTESLELALDAPKVVATTCLGINHPLIVRRGRFDLVVVDEASQVLQPICLGPLQFAGGPFILVGDHYQLPPLLRMQKPNGSADASCNVKKLSRETGGIADKDVCLETQTNESLFRRLCEFHPEAMISLSKQYRMASDIMRLSNELVYSGSLSCGSDQVALQELKVSTERCRTNRTPWLESVTDPSRAVVFLDLPQEDSSEVPESDSHRRGEDSRRDNSREAEVVLRCITELVNKRVKSEDITVLSPFRAQVSLISEMLRTVLENDDKDSREVGVYTIDQYQGRDNKCIIISFVRSNGSVGPLLKDWRRINVAITRAKQKLILVGSSKTLLKGGFFLQGLISSLGDRHSIVSVP